MLFFQKEGGSVEACLIDIERPGKEDGLMNTKYKFQGFFPLELFSGNIVHMI